MSGNRQMEEVGNANTPDQLQCCLQNGIQTESGNNTKKICKIWNSLETTVIFIIKKYLIQRSLLPLKSHSLYTSPCPK